MDVPYMDGSSSELLSILAKKELFWKFSGSPGAFAISRAEDLITHYQGRQIIIALIKSCSLRYIDLEVVMRPK